MVEQSLPPHVVAAMVPKFLAREAQAPTARSIQLQGREIGAVALLLTLLTGDSYPPVVRPAAQQVLDLLMERVRAASWGDGGLGIHDEEPDT